MAGRRLALKESPRPSSPKKRSRRGKRSASDAPGPARELDFSELEQDFFAAAPPEDPGPTAEPERFDDLVALGPPRRQMFGALLRAVATAGAALRRFFQGPGRRSRSASRRQQRHRRSSSF
jgi:hypothetical protein